MGRPKTHDEHTAAALLDAAERIAETDGAGALTVRRVAEAGGTTTRAVYSLFGSKEGLAVALGARAFDLLRVAIEALPATADPAADLVEAGAGVFRRFAIEHPSLFRVGVQHALPEPGPAAGFRPAAWAAPAQLEARIERMRDAGLLGGRSVRATACEFHALCEGLAAMELRSSLPAGDEEWIWRDALTALVRGFAAPAMPRSSIDRKTA